MTSTHLDRLVDFLTDGDAADGLAADLRGWMASSRGFRTFADTHRDKVRKKIRTARGRDARLDVRAELAVAHALLADRRISLAYERAGATSGGPDFTVIFRGHSTFNLEVTRWCGDEATLERQLVAKLRQLPPGIPNALLVAVADSAAAVPDLATVLGERRPAPFETREVRQQLTRLGGVYAWSSPGAEPRATLWTNGSARIALPAAAARAVMRALEDAS